MVRWTILCRLCGYRFHFVLSVSRLLLAARAKARLTCLADSVSGANRCRISEILATPTPSRQLNSAVLWVQSTLAHLTWRLRGMTINFAPQHGHEKYL
jgi:hypothetical protein